MDPKVSRPHTLNVEKGEETELEEGLKEKTQEDSPNEAPEASLHALGASLKALTPQSHTTETLKSKCQNKKQNQERLRRVKQLR